MRMFILLFVIAAIPGCDVFRKTPKVVEKHSEIAVLESDHADLVLIPKDSKFASHEITHLQAGDEADPVLTYLFAWRSTREAKELHKSHQKDSKRAKEEDMIGRYGPIGVQNF